MIVKNLLIFECLLKLSYCQDIEKRIYYNTLIVTTTTRKKKQQIKQQQNNHKNMSLTKMWVSTQSFANNFFSSPQTFSILLLLSDNTLMYAPKLNLSKRLQTIDF